MSEFLDERYKCLQPYVPGQQPQNTEYIKLNTNELPYPPAPTVLQAISKEAMNVNRYPDPDAKVLLAALAKRFGVSPNQCYAGNGSDEILAFCFQIYCQNGIAFPDITYGFYPVYSQLYRVETKTVPLRKGFVLDTMDYFDLNRTILLANPNAPCGLAISVKQVEEILMHNKHNMVIIDEAYVDFGAESAISLVDKYRNLIVVGTFSKSRAMAGARLGYAIANPDVINDLNTVKNSFNPYNLNRMTIAAGVAALEDTAYFEECIGKIMDTRDYTIDKMRRMGFECTDSRANFVFARHPDITGETLYKALWEKNILVRWWNRPRIENYLRITVGTKQEMDALLGILEEMFA